MRIAHVIAGLGVGGAEGSLALLSARLVAKGHQIEVACLGPEGPLAEQLRVSGAEVMALDAEGVPSGVAAVARLARAWRRRPPDVVHGWMVHGNLAALAAARAAGLKAPVVWGLRMSNMSPALNSRSTLALTRLSGVLSGRGPAAIVANGEAAVRAHGALGYAVKKIRVIPNGIDTGRFRPNSEARALVRSKLGLPEDALLFALVGRHDPQKDLPGFLYAAAAWRAAPAGARFLLCGPGVDAEDPALSRAAGIAGRDRVILLAARPDPEHVWAATDVAVSSSLGESFPNAAAEAMACGVPCVATDVGDCRAVVGDTGLIVPPADPEALAKAMETMVGEGADGRRRRGEQARRRIEERFGAETMADRYLAVYGELIS